MNRRFDLHLLGWLLLVVAGLLLVPLVAAVAFEDAPGPFVSALLLAGVAGAGLVAVTQTKERNLRARDGFLVVSGAWAVTSLVGALPYLLSGSLGPVDALFESVSGFTTTGSTVIADVSALPRSLLLWRAMTQWLGGMGIILFTIAILPLLGIGGMQLFKAEVPGPVADKVRPRLAATARTLWGLYVGFTVAQWLALMLCGLSWFDALCHALTTLATGGFSTRNASVGEFSSPAVEWVVIVFMLAAGMNFVLHYKALTGRWSDVVRDVELRYFLAVVGGAAVLLFAVLWDQGKGVHDTVRAALFQTVSIVTTTGYVSVDYELWPHAAQFLLVALMLFGGMSGSTGGGPKSLRILLALRSLRATVHRFIHPHAVVPVKYHGQVVSDGVLSGVAAFLTAYVLLAGGAAAVVTAAGYDFATAVSASLTAIGNVGPGLGAVGAMDNFSSFPAAVKLLLSACMLLGRLEIFTILVLFSRQFWRH
ncbi:MAG: TrkH family potassium uptake protein [Acidobacteriota bacterium]|jgi:trk system potassium uptake protein TrkH